MVNSLKKWHRIPSLSNMYGDRASKVTLLTPKVSLLHQKWHFCPFLISGSVLNLPLGIFSSTDQPFEPKSATFYRKVALFGVISSKSGKFPLKSVISLPCNQISHWNVWQNGTFLALFSRKVTKSATFALFLESVQPWTYSEALFERGVTRF